ncbi:hypothetical protein LTR84_001319 [Exophiala bonariae]|uniref:Copper transporter n=1 Tax=Exophiala bonariae TaxID=1690606 RepID=A0AAV9NCG3_9EURO|nr:hypothetical protein LTR84_001319 [Exophiala bonariae]
MYQNPFSGTFFLDWAIWARLSLILAGCFIIVLTTAYIVKFKSWLQDRRFEKKAAQQEERGETAFVSHAGDKIPFGIRALIEDAQIEGVWHSRPLTPLNPNDIPDHTLVSFDGPAPTTHTRGGSSVSSTAVPEAADIDNGSPYGWHELSAVSSSANLSP